LHLEGRGLLRPGKMKRKDSQKFSVGVLSRSGALKEFRIAAPAQKAGAERKQPCIAAALMIAQV
jgi:hypothetical protein